MGPTGRARALRAAILAGAIAIAPASAIGQPACDAPDAAACAVDPGPPTAAPASPLPEAGARTLVVFWAEGCRRCEQARPAVARLAAARPDLTVEWVEIGRSAAGRARFQEATRRTGIEGAGTPLFVFGDRAIVGYRGEATDAELADALDRGLAPRAIDLPIVGWVDEAHVSLPTFTVLVGLVDGVNPCAFYVLVVLLGLLLHVRSRARVALYGGVFVIASGVVYFLFMTAWLGVFLAAGVSRALTSALGAALVVMGLVNLKELVWFARGPSLMIPDRAKPGLFRRMRGVAGAASLPAALLGVTALALVVNLVELGCTLGLPAVYTRVLSLRADLGTGARAAYLALYNVAYVVPLAVIVAVAVASMKKLALTERRAKVLKAVSGALLVAFGAVFLAAPDLLR